MALTPGTRLGVYEVIAHIGEGGMGQVYRARDTTLNRDVALKILPDAFATDKDRLARFTREAQTLAALNHPHIAHIHGLEDFAGVRALVMELVEGDDLSQRLARGAIPVSDAVPIARQIAEALEAAHEQGIIHRDLKPANIKVRDDGTVKVLDFGLAKALDTIPAGTTADYSPTITSPAMTQAGVVLGTAAYMAPEQAKGRAADRRSDVWAFGAVVYEMLTGVRPFNGEDVPETLAFILTREPEWTLLPADTPPAMQRMLRRCLEKSPKRRLQAIAEARIQIDDLSSGAIGEAAPPGMPAATVAGWRRALPRAGIGLIAAMAGAMGTWLAVRSPVPALPVTRFSLVLPELQPLATSLNDRDVTFSVDGAMLAFTAGTQYQLMVHALDQLEARPVAGVTNARAPLFSPDGRWIGFFSQLEEGLTTGALREGDLQRVSIAGGAPIVICRVTGGSRGASWAPDNTIVFATNDDATGLLRVSASGGAPATLTTPDRSKRERDHHFPSMLPGDRGVLFTVLYDDGSPPQVAVLDLKTGVHRTLGREGSQPVYAGSGHLVYVAARGLWAVRFDLAALEVVGDPGPIAEQVMTTATANFSISPSGALVYARSTMERGGDRSLVWVSRTGEQVPVAAPPRRYDFPRLSPDSTQVAVRISDSGAALWNWNFEQQTFTRLTPDGRYSPGVWDPDGRSIVVSEEATEWIMWRRRSDGSGAGERLMTSSRFFMPIAIPPDRSRLIYQEYQRPEADFDLMMVSLNGPPRPEPLVRTPAEDRSAEISPDGRWLAYESNQSRRSQIYVRPFPNVADAEYQVSTAGGRTPLWAPNGKELYFNNGASLMAVAIETTPSFRAGSPERLFENRSLLLDSRTFSTGAHRTYDIKRDGQHFLAMTFSATSSSNAAPPSIVVVQNWFEELKRLLPMP